MAKRIQLSAAEREHLIWMRQNAPGQNWYGVKAPNRCIETCDGLPLARRRARLFPGAIMVKCTRRLRIVPVRR